MVTMSLPHPPVRETPSAAPVVPADTQAQAAAAREALIAQHLPLVRYVAGAMARHAGASAIVDYDDLVGYGSEGLIAAVETFNPSYDVKFSTWAVMHIRTTIQDALRTLDPLPRSLRAKGKAIERASAELAHRTGQWPDEIEVAAALAMPLAKLRRTMQDLSTVTVSLDGGADMGGEEQGAAWAASLADEDPAGDPQQALDQAETAVMLGEAVAALPARERAVVQAYYRQGRHMRDIAAELGVSESRVSQLHARALKLLRNHLTAALDDTPRSRAA